MEVRGVRGGWADRGFIWNPLVDAESNDSGYKASFGDDDEGCPGKEITDMDASRTVGM